MSDRNSLVGKTLGPYKVAAHIGAGGMGEVYLAEDTRLGRQVALKFLPPSLQNDHDRRARLLREAQAVSRLHSPSIAVTHDISEVDGALFIVMEYVDGETLARRLERGPLSLPRAVRLAMQAADALDEAHALGIIHRDIKSANLMITGRGHLKVLDFGLTKLVGPSLENEHRANSAITLDEPTAAGALMGTVSYMSPEQALGRPLDHRSDLFSLGIVMYEMVTAKLPFVGNTSLAVSDAIVHATPAALKGEDGEASAAYERIVKRCVEKAPEARYPTARELYDDLRQLRRSLDAVAYIESSDAVTAVGRGTVGLAVSSLRREDQEPATRSASLQQPDYVVAVMPFVNITKREADDWIGTGIAETVTSDLKAIRGLSVIGSERVFDAMKGADAAQSRDFDPRRTPERVAIELGRRLAATWIVVGGYQLVGDALRITARAVDIGTGTVAKTVKVDGPMAEIFSLQDRVVDELGRDLKQDLNHSLCTSSASPAVRENAPPVEAFECFTRGVIRIREATRDSMDQAILLFEQAAELHPAYARAWAGLAAAYGLKGQFQGLPRLLQKAAEAGRRAVALDPRLPEAHQWLGAAHQVLGEEGKALEHLEEAIRLDPTSSLSHLLLSRVLWLRLGRIDEAIEAAERASHLSPEAGQIHMQLGLMYTQRERYEEAEASCHKAINLERRTNFGLDEMRTVGSRMRLGYVFYRQGRYEEAIEAYRQERADLSSRRDHALSDRTLIELEQKLGAALLRSGQPEDAAQCLSQAIESYEKRRATGAGDPFTQYYIACACALRGDAAQAIRHFAASSTKLGALNRWRGATDPDLETIRAELIARDLIAVVPV